VDVVWGMIKSEVVVVYLIWYGGESKWKECRGESRSS
jgi:hypothetical protein